MSCLVFEMRHINKTALSCLKHQITAILVKHVSLNSFQRFTMIYREYICVDGDASYRSECET